MGLPRITAVEYEDREVCELLKVNRSDGETLRKGRRIT